MRHLDCSEDFIIKIDQPKAIKLGLNIIEATVLAIVRDNPMIDSYKISSIFIIGEKKIDTINRILNKLFEKKLIVKHTYSDIEVFNKLNNSHHKGCLFCGVDDIILDKHHYPIRRKDGGGKTINLCPNCHRRFHTMADYRPQYTIKGNLI